MAARTTKTDDDKDNLSLSFFHFSRQRQRPAADSDGEEEEEGGDDGEDDGDDHGAEASSPQADQLGAHLAEGADIHLVVRGELGLVWFAWEVTDETKEMENVHLCACSSWSRQRPPGCRWSGSSGWSAHSKKKILCGAKI